MKIGVSWIESLMVPANEKASSISNRVSWLIGPSIFVNLILPFCLSSLSSALFCHFVHYLHISLLIASGFSTFRSKIVSVLSSFSRGPWFLLLTWLKISLFTSFCDLHVRLTVGWLDRGQKQSNKKQVLPVPGHSNWLTHKIVS